MARTKWLAAVNPFLVAIYPVLFLYAKNVREVNPEAAMPPTLAAAGVAALLLLLLWVILRDVIKAGFIASAWLVVFFFYGHLADLIADQTVGGILVGRLRYLLSGVLGFAAITFWFAVRFPKPVRAATPYMTILLVFVTALNTAIVARDGRLFDDRHVQPNVIDQVVKTGAEELPDIYYIVLDGYARADVLQELFNYNNDEFLGYLRENDFHVSVGSRSNYVLTFLSLASALNMEYLDEIAGVASDPKDGTLPYRMTSMIRSNRVMKIAKDMGYRVFYVLSGWDTQNWASGLASLPEKDVVTFPLRRMYPLGAAGKAALQPLVETEFGSVFLNTTILRLLIAPWLGFADAEIYSDGLEHLKSISEMESPTFTFAHFIPPHPPFIFDRNGNFGRGEQLEQYSLREWQGKESYIDQLIWVNRSVKSAVSHILERNKRSIIIIQSDHGSKFSRALHDPRERLVWEYTSNLHAVHLSPNCKSDGVYESMTPVNTFRYVFRSCFGAKFDLLEDKTFWSISESPYDFTLLGTTVSPSNQQLR